MNDTDKLALLRQRTNKRQTKYYQAHKAVILAKKQREREQLRIMNSPPPPPIVLPIEYTLEMIQDIFTENCDNANTRKKYNGDMKRIFKICELQYFTTTIDTYNAVKESLDSSKYSLQTRRGCIQSILVFIDKSGIVCEPKITALYSVLYEVYGIKCTDQNDKRKTNGDDDVMDYDAYMKLILDHYGVDSKQYLIVSLYKECCMRDDFGLLEVIDDLDNDNNTENFIFRHEGSCSIIMNTYKTSTVYGKLIYPLTEHLDTLINNYIDNNNIIQNGYADFLFPDRKKLSVYITNMNKKIGLLGIGINTFRHSIISTFLSNPDLTAEQRHNFAIRAGHKEETQKNYRRGVKGVLDPSLREYATDTI